MVSSKETTVAEYLAQLPADRRELLQAVRSLVNESLPRGYEEGMLYGMISWFVPLSRFPNTYNGQPLTVASLGAQKNYTALYLMGAYGEDGVKRRLEEAYSQADRKLDMGKSCLRFKRFDELVVPAVKAALRSVSVQNLIDSHDSAHSSGAKAARKAAKSSAKKKTATKKKTTKKKTTKKKPSTRVSSR